jgi:hypothetical protein
MSAIWRIQKGATVCRKFPPVPDTACAIKARNSSGVYARRQGLASRIVDPDGEVLVETIDGVATRSFSS